MAASSIAVLDYPPSSSITQPWKHKEMTLFGPGPTNVAPRVCHGASLQVYGILNPIMIDLMNEIQDGLRYIFQTKNELTYVVNASGMGGMETALANTLERGDKFMSLSNGYWGVMATDIAERCGAIAVTIEHGPGVPFTLEEVDKALQEHRPVVMYVAQSESSTGLLQPIEGLGPLCHKYDCLLVVDTVASLCAAPFFMDKWEVDVVYTATQKAISSPPGLAPISFSDRARKRIAARKTKVHSFLFDVNKSMIQWGIDGQKRSYHHTYSSTLYCALREALSMIAVEGLEQMWKRHAQNTQKLCDGIKELGLELFIKDPKYRLPTVTFICVPSNIKTPYLLNSYCMEKYNLEFGFSLPPLSGKGWRIGLMGYNCTEWGVKRALEVFRDGLIHIGYNVPPQQIKAEL